LKQGSEGSVAQAEGHRSKTGHSAQNINNINIIRYTNTSVNDYLMRRFRRRGTPQFSNLTWGTCHLEQGQGHRVQLPIPPSGTLPMDLITDFNAHFSTTKIALKISVHCYNDETDIDNDDDKNDDDDNNNNNNNDLF